MDKTIPCYTVRIPMPGQPDGFHDVGRALQPEGAAELARVLLALNDPAITEIRIVVGVTLLSQV